jgi:hypothetical protein
MQNKTEQILNDLVADYADVLFHANSKVRKFPKSFTDKVCELKKSGVSLSSSSTSILPVIKSDSSVVKLLFKSGVQMELRAESLDSKLLKLLNELGQ